MLLTRLLIHAALASRKKVYSKTNLPFDSFGESVSLSDFTKTNAAFHIDAIARVAMTR